MSDFLTKLLPLVEISLSEKYSLKKIYQGLNELWFYQDQANNLILKKYNFFWVQSQSSVYHNIVLGNEFAKKCQLAGLNSSIALLTRPVLIDKDYWQLFDYIKPDDFSDFVFSDVFALIDKFKLVASKDLLNSFAKYEFLPLSVAEQKKLNSIDKELACWYNDFNIAAVDVFSHRDLTKNNLIKNKNQIHIIDFDCSGPRTLMVDKLSLALDFGYMKAPNELLELYSLKQLKKEALPALLFEWRCWYHQLSYLSSRCVGMHNIFLEQKSAIQNQLLKQLNGWFGSSCCSI